MELLPITCALDAITLSNWVKEARASLHRDHTKLYMLKHFSFSAS